MCKPLAEGGQRCAAHTRLAYQSAEPGTPGWDEAAAAYASTPAGRKDLEAELVRVSEAHTRSLIDASAIREYARSEDTRGWTPDAAEEERAIANAHLRTAQALENALKRGAVLRERTAEVKTAIQLRGPDRPSTAAPDRGRSIARPTGEARQRQAEEVIFLINHGYTADARYEMGRFTETFGSAIETETEAPEAMPRLGRRKQAVKEQRERQAHAEKVLALISQNSVDDARDEARRFAQRFGTGYDPDMAGSTAGPAR